MQGPEFLKGFQKELPLNLRFLPSEQEFITSHIPELDPMEGGAGFIANTVEEWVCINSFLSQPSRKHLHSSLISV